MSDDPKEKPKKLRLARDTSRNTNGTDSPSTQEKSGETRSSANEIAQKADANPSPENTPEVSAEPQGTEKPQGPPKLQREITGSEDSPESGVAADPETKSKLKLKQNTGNSRDAAEGAQSPQSVSERPRSGVSGKNNDTLRLDDPGVVDKKPHSLLPSLLILGLLFLLLGAAGFGLWMLLFSAEPSETSSERQPIAVAEDSQNQETAKESGAKNPIERAKETIASVPKLDLDELSGQSESESKVESAPVVESAPEAEITRQVATPEAENKKTNEKTNAMQVDSAAKAMSTPAPRTESTAEMEATKATVSEFLGSLHIGGMRQGARPMILIEGQPHTVGDTVQAETGLKFDGIRDGKLAFIDENDVVYLKSF